MNAIMRAAFPIKAIMMLLGIGLLDLISTAWLYHQGMIVEMNPLMRFLLEHGEWSFILVKGLTLAISWIALASYAKQNPAFVRKVCVCGSIAYVGLWVMWVAVGNS
jgi:hypothetical protein